MVYNKIDLISGGGVDRNSDGIRGGLVTYGLTGFGVNELKKHIITTLDLENNSSENFGITTPRQYSAITKSDAAIKAVLEIVNHLPIQLELVSFELQNALRGVEDLLGIKTAEEILFVLVNSFT